MASSVARTLRRNPTEAERHLSSRLRRCQLDGFKFRRQVPIGPFVGDFACLPARLVIEVDGGQHSWQSERDEAHTAWLELAGFRVVRFWNNEVLVTTDGVVERIRDALHSPLPDPPPQGGREKPRASLPPKRASPPETGGKGWSAEQG